MTLAEWSGVHTVLTALWPRQHKAPDEDQLEAEHAALPAGLGVEEAIGAVRQIWLTGEKWPPSGGEIAALAMKVARPPAPALGTVIGLLEVAAGKFGRDREADALRWLSERSPHAARAAYEIGWRQFCLSGLHGEYAGAERNRLEPSIGGAIRGLEKEITEQRVLPLVGDRIRMLESGREERRGLRLMSAEALLPDRPELEAGDGPSRRRAAE